MFQGNLILAQSEGTEAGKMISMQSGSVQMFAGGWPFKISWRFQYIMPQLGVLLNTTDSGRVWRWLQGVVYCISAVAVSKVTILILPI